MIAIPVSIDWFSRSDGPMYRSAGSSPSPYFSRATSARVAAFSAPCAMASAKRSKLRNGPAS